MESFFLHDNISDFPWLQCLSGRDRLLRTSVDIQHCKDAQHRCVAEVHAEASEIGFMQTNVCVVADERAYVWSLQ